jgi:hypothetical protein
VADEPGQCHFSHQLRLSNRRVFQSKPMPSMSAMITM